MELLEEAGDMFPPLSGLLWHFEFAVGLVHFFSLRLQWQYVVQGQHGIRTAIVAADSMMQRSQTGAVGIYVPKTGL